MNAGIEELMSLSYLSYVPNDPTSGKEGVIFYEQNLSYPGFNLHISRHMAGASLLDMNGNTLHSWFPKGDFDNIWWLPEIDENGNLLAVISRVGLVKMDWDSNIIWIRNGSENPDLTNHGRYHHDLEVAENGDIYVLGEQIRYISHKGQMIPIRDHYIVYLSSEGNPIKTMSFYDLLGGKIPIEVLDKLAAKIKTKEELTREDIDVFHSNTIEEIALDIGIAKKGDLLFCIRHLDLIGIIDRETEKIVWSWGPGILDWPHNPTVLENGNILLFDNGAHRNYTRILELNPVSEELVWRYEGDPRESFYTEARGSNQRLPNGNTLITESDKGRVFEVTRDGEIVWEFLNPVFDDKGRRATMERMVRLEESSIRNLFEKGT